MEQAGLTVRRSDERLRGSPAYVTDEDGVQSKIDDVDLSAPASEDAWEDQVELERLLRSLGENLSVKSRGDGNP